MKRLVTFLSAIAITACGSTSSSPTNGGTDTGAASDAPFSTDAPSTPALTSGSIGPIPVGPGEDKTVCINKRLDNVDELLATRLVADLEPGSHHMIIYKSTATTETLDPFDCNPFESLITSSDAPLMLVNARHVDFSFPAGVGLKLEAHQMVRIEAHYVNASKTAIEGKGAFSVQGKKLAEAGDYQLADFSFWGTRNFSIAPMSHGDTGKKFQKGIANTKGFALTTHQHGLGTQVDVWMSASSTDVPATPILTEMDWSAPKLVPVDLAFDGTNGLTYECQWENPSPTKTVKFGESGLTAEMCFVLLYYYPSHGFDFCLDGTCKVAH
jgi:hypothetical protein